MKNVIRYYLRLSLPLFGVPLSNRINPIYVAVLDYPIEIIIGDELTCEACHTIPQVNEIINILGEELGEKLGFNIYLSRFNPMIPFISYYSVATLSLSLILSELLELDIKDVTESLMGIETELFNRELIQVIQALRLSTLNNKPLLYRYGEEAVVIEDARQCFISTENVDRKEMVSLGNEIFYRIEDIDNELGDLITKLAGLTTLKAYNSVHLGNPEDVLISTYCRIENMIWYLEYGLIPPVSDFRECVKWIPNIGKPTIIALSLDSKRNSGRGIRALC